MHYKAEALEAFYIKKTLPRFESVFCLILSKF